MVLALVLVVALLGALGMSRLLLRTSLRELVPSGDVTGEAIDEAQRRVGEYATLVVAIRPGGAPGGEAWAEELARRLSALDPRLCERAVFRVDGLREFFRENRWLYADEQLLSDVRDRLRFELQRRKNPLPIRLDEPPELDVPKARAAAALHRRHRLALVAWQGTLRDTDGPPPDELTRRALAIAAAGRILLLHDNPTTRGATAAALPGIIAGYRRLGFSFVVLGGDGAASPSPAASTGRASESSTKPAVTKIT